MRLLLQKICRPFFVWLALKFSAAPRRQKVFAALSHLYRLLIKGSTGKGMALEADSYNAKFIIFSDQHKGAKDTADDFENNAFNYVSALRYYNHLGFTFINLGDAEELWKYKMDRVLPAYKDVLKEEAAFQQGGRYYRVFGNHDVAWKNKLDVSLNLEKYFSAPLPVYEALLLELVMDKSTAAPAASATKNILHIFLTHGHQGDGMSDGNAFSAWIIAHIWAPLQRLLNINVNTPSNDTLLRNKHNKMMYEWSQRKKNLLLITGHTHQPVFASGKYNISDKHKIAPAAEDTRLLPTYYNTGCCCFNDGDITGIEIEAGCIRLVKWHTENNISVKKVLEESTLDNIYQDIQTGNG